MPDYLSKLKPPEGARKKPIRVGRGVGSTLGKTSGRGQKGYGARSGSKRNWGFEGGQMPLQRRMPKRGFFNPMKKVYTILNLRDIERWELEEVSPEVLMEKHLVKKIGPHGLKILGDGEIKRPVTVKAHRISAQAASKISAAGGKPVIIEPPSAGGGTKTSGESSRK